MCAQSLNRHFKGWWCCREDMPESQRHLLSRCILGLAASGLGSLVQHFLGRGYLSQFYPPRIDLYSEVAKIFPWFPSTRERGYERWDMTVLLIQGTSRIMTCCYHLLGQFFSTKNACPKRLLSWAVIIMIAHRYGAWVWRMWTYFILTVSLGGKALFITLIVTDEKIMRAQCA